MSLFERVLIKSCLVANLTFVSTKQHVIMLILERKEKYIYIYMTTHAKETQLKLVFIKVWPHTPQVFIFVNMTNLYLII